MDARSELDSLLDVNDKQTNDDSLDDLLNHTEADVELRPKPNNKPRRIKSFRKSAKLPGTIKSKANDSAASKIETTAVNIEENEANTLSKLDEVAELIQEQPSDTKEILNDSNSNMKLHSAECNNNIQDNNVTESKEDKFNPDAEMFDKVNQHKVQDVKAPSSDKTIEINDMQVKDDTQASNEGDVLLDINVDHVKDDSLDDLLNADGSDSMLKPQKSKKLKRIKSLRKSIKGTRDEIKQAIAAIDQKQNTTNQDKEVEKVDTKSSFDESKTNLSNLPSVPSEDVLSKELENNERKESENLEIEAVSKISDSVTSNIVVEEAESVLVDTLKFKPVESDLEKEEKDLEDVLKENNEKAGEDSLDDILKPTNDDVIMRKKPSIKARRIKSFRKSLKGSTKSKEELTGTRDTKPMKTELEERDTQTAMIESNQNGGQENTEVSTVEPVNPNPIQLQQGLPSPVTPEVSLESICNEPSIDTASANEIDIENQTDQSSLTEKLHGLLTTSIDDAPEGEDNHLEFNENVSDIKDKPKEKVHDLLSSEITSERVTQNQTTDTVEINGKNIKQKNSRRPKRVKSIRRSKIFLDDDYDPFAPEAQNSATKKEDTHDIDQSLDSLLDAQLSDAASDNNSLDRQDDSQLTELLPDEVAPSQSIVAMEDKVAQGDTESANDDPIKPKPSKRPKRIKSIRKSKIFIDEDYDPFGTEGSNDLGGSYDVDQSLDSLLEVQPKDVLPKNDKLMSVDTTNESKITAESSHPHQGNEESISQDNDSYLQDDDTMETTCRPEVVYDETDRYIHTTEKQEGEKLDKGPDMSHYDLVSKESSKIDLVHDEINKIEESIVEECFEASHKVRSNQNEGEKEMNLDSFDDLDRILQDERDEALTHLDDLDSSTVSDEAAGADDIDHVSPTTGPEQVEKNENIAEITIDKDGPEVLQLQHM